MRENGHFSVVGQLSKCKARTGQVTCPTGKDTCSQAWRPGLTSRAHEGNRENQFPPVILWPDLNVHTVIDKHLSMCAHIPAPTE